MTWTLRFLHAVDGLPAWMWLITGLVAAYGSALTWMDPRGAEDALGMLLLWQMLCASRGYAGHARAGHFDPVLIRRPRAAIALAHALLAIAPVSIAWALAGVTELARGESGARAFEHGRLAAFMFVGCTAWAVSLPAPRLIIGSLWVATIVAAATTRVGLEQYGDLLARPAGALQFVHALAVTMVCPFVMLGSPLPQRFEVSIALVLLAAAAIAAGMLFIARRQYALEPAQ